MAVTVTNSTIAALNTEQTFTANAATSTAVNTAEVFTFTPTKAGSKIALNFSNLGSTAAVTYSIAAGDLWAGKAITGTIAGSAQEILQFDSARVLQDDGTVAITVTPSTGTILLGDHAFKLYALELL